MRADKIKGKKLCKSCGQYVPKDEWERGLCDYCENEMNRLNEIWEDSNESR